MVTVLIENDTAAADDKELPVLLVYSKVRPELGAAATQVPVKPLTIEPDAVTLKPVGAVQVSPGIGSVLQKSTMIP